MEQEFYWCQNKSSSTKYIYDKWNHIRTIIVPFSFYYIRNPSLYVPIRKVLLGFLQLGLFLTLTVFIVTILFNANLFFNCIRFFLMNHGLLIISAITPGSAITQFYLFLFTASIPCQNLLVLTPITKGFFISKLYKTLLYLQSLHQQLF